MATNLCAPAVEEEAQNPGLPRYLISQSQPVPVRPQEKRVELLPVATPLASARQPPVVAEKPKSQLSAQIFLEEASESFPASAFLFLVELLSLSLLFCLWKIPFPFAIFSSLPLVLASGWEIFSISLEQQLIQAFPSVLALASPRLPHQSLPFYCCPAIPLALPTRQFRYPTLLWPASLSGSDLMISWVSGKDSVSSSTYSRSLWLWQPASMMSSVSGTKRREPLVGSFRIRRPTFLRRCRLAREGGCRRSH